MPADSAVAERLFAGDPLALGAPADREPGSGEPSPGPAGGACWATLPGKLFRRVLSDGISEVAQVIAATDDRMGRPHVRVVVWTLGRGDACAHEVRTMALASFLAQFDERP